MWKSPSYRPVRTSNADEANLPSTDSSTSKPKSLWPPFFALAHLAIIALLIVDLTISFQWRESKVDTQNYTGIGTTKIWKQHQWRTDYSSHNSTLSDQLWATLNPTRGFIAVDSEWAAAKQLPETRVSPDDPGKRVFVLDAFHQLHCLQVIRRSLMDYRKGIVDQPEEQVEHVTHCMVEVRQGIMCSAADTPFYTFGDGTNGDGQTRRCRDWDALVGWAAERAV